jgi:hypothetical protein
MHALARFGMAAACVVQGPDSLSGSISPDDVLSVGVTKFNVKPSKGIQFLCKARVIGDDARAVASFLRHTGYD